MSEHDDEIRAKCQWLIDNKYIVSPVETGMLICEVFDAFKEVESLKVQLKRERDCVNAVVNQEKAKGFPLLSEWRELVGQLSETVKARET